MLWSRTRRKVMAFTLVEVLVVSGLITGMHAKGRYGYAISHATEMKGIHNLKQIHLLVRMHCMMNKLPKAAFYPKGDPKKDPKSIIRLLGRGASPKLFVSPFAPDALKKKGLTYAWNDTVNGKSLDRLPKNTWLLVDLAAFVADPKVPKPSKYLILYADGRALALKKLPADIQKAVKDARAKAGKDKKKAG
jgi:hypothetical protein